MKRRPRFRMNTLELRMGAPEPGVDVLIDGRDLRETVRALETPHADRPELAGSYGGIPRGEWDDPVVDEWGRVAVLGCTCGVTACWPLFARIECRPGTVVWSDFLGPMGQTAYERLGPFTFAREQYESALAALASRR